MIATGFDEEADRGGTSAYGSVSPKPPTGRLADVIRPDFGKQAPSQLPQEVAAVGGGAASVVPLPRPPERVVTQQQIDELDVPTFIRRQMD